MNILETQDEVLDASGGSQVLYLLHNPVTDLVKVGITSDLRRRMRDLERAGGVRLVIFAALMSTDRRSVAKWESAIHARYAEQREQGEWFRISGPLLAEWNH